MRSTSTRPFLPLLAALAMLCASHVSPAEAGCGCDKAPPAPAPVRPNVTYAGQPVTLFSSTFVVGNTYTVRFSSGTIGWVTSVPATVVVQKDIADGYAKPMLVVPVPTMPLGPTSITATRDGATQPDVSIADKDFVVAPTPVAVPYNYGNWEYPNTQAAVGRNGVLYLSLDMTGVTSPLVFDAQMVGYAYRFGAANVVFTNTQGFLMQLLLNSRSQAIPGMFVTKASSPTTASDVLRYSRHEFSTYFLQHMERLPHAVTPDGNWHLDGTRHVDHNHLIIAISGKLNSGLLAPAGATPAFKLVVKAYSLFYKGITGTGSVAMSGGAMTDSQDSNTMLFGSGGDVFTLGTLTMKDTTKVMGNVTAKSVSKALTSTITGTKYTAVATTFMAITVPPGLPSLGSISSTTATTQTIYGPGSFAVSSIALSGGARLFIDNSTGPVTLYVSGAVTVSGGTIQTADPKPEKFAIYVTGTSTVTLNTKTSFYGVVYAPNSTVAISNSGDFTGGFFGKALTMGLGARVHYDSTLIGQF